MTQHASSDSKPQLLHLVFGGELVDLDSHEFRDPANLDIVGIFPDYPSAYDKAWLAKANALIPPNVFPFQHGGLAAKYAVLSEADFHRLNGPQTLNVSVWARFAQPSRLVWAADMAGS